MALAAILVIVALVIALSGSSPPTIGYDISYPQCSGSYPSNPLFGIVGVDGGTARSANSCIGEELQWARAAPGQKRPPQPSLSLYIDTGDPGGHHVADWPSAGAVPAYGVCDGLLTDSCSYIYGERRAAHSYRLLAALDPVAARTAPWWLDVELTETWAGSYQLNLAALRGFVAGLRDAGAAGPIGIYSTSAQWREITGLTSRTTPSAFHAKLPDWVAGTGATLGQARRNCASGGFTGLAPSIAQYEIGSLDADLRCARAGRGRRALARLRR